MKKMGITIIAVLAFTHLFSQRNLTIRKNQTKMIEAGLKSLLLDTLILEDNSKIVIADGVPAFSLIAKHVIIGYNVIIDGTRKTAAVNGMNGEKGADAPGYCQIAGTGQNGKNGTDGYDAADIFLYLRIRSIGSLTIKAPGTAAGSGGDGGNGGKGADSNPNLLSNCIAKPGGPGGNGGNGGDGGSGGTIVFNYTFLDPSGNYLASQPALSQVEVVLSGGNGGAGGRGGQKGQPGKKTSGYVDQSLNQSVTVATGGTTGKTGKAGVFITTAIKQNL